MNTYSKTLLFTGDSITDGGRNKKKNLEWDGNHQMGHSFPYIINGILGSQFPEKNLIFKNKGVSGNRIIDLYARINTDLIDIKPDILTILVGVNDGPGELNGFRATPKEKYERLYRQFLQEVKSQLPNCKIVLIEPFVCNAGKLREEYNQWRECILGYGEVVGQMAREFDTLFLPLQDKFDKLCQTYPAEYWSWDGVHPTENGHGLIAVEWMKLMDNEL